MLYTATAVSSEIDIKGIKHLEPFWRIICVQERPTPMWFFEEVNEGQFPKRPLGN
jgi:hypothetical protein